MTTTIHSEAAVRRQMRQTATLAVGLALVSLATLTTVWSMQHAGYVPCELCLLERNPFYLAMPLGLLTAWAAARRAAGWSFAGFVLLTLLFLAGAAVAAYHAGVEWQWWAGPSGCSGPMPTGGSVADFRRQLDTIHVVRCDAPALVIFGLSLAGWNVLLSLVLAALSAWGAAVSRRAVALPPGAV